MSENEEGNDGIDNNIEYSLETKRTECMGDVWGKDEGENVCVCVVIFFDYYFFFSLTR